MTKIKRYSNRKLYDVEAARYVTLDELGERIRSGEEFSVIDHDSGADMTALTLIQIMFEREKHAGGMLPRAILTGLIQAGNVAVGTVRSGINALVENTPAIEAEIRRRLAVLVEDGQVAVEEAQRFTDLLVSNRWKRSETVADNPTTPPAEPQAAPVMVSGAAVYPVETPDAPPAPTYAAPEPIAPPPTGEVERLRQQIDDLERQIAEIRSRRG